MLLEDLHGRFSCLLRTGSISWCLEEGGMQFLLCPYLGTHCSGQGVTAGAGEVGTYNQTELDFRIPGSGL